MNTDYTALLKKDFEKKFHIILSQLMGA